MVVIGEPESTVVKCFIFRLGSCDGEAALTPRRAPENHLGTLESLGVLSPVRPWEPGLDPVCIVTGGDSPSTGATGELTVPPGVVVNEVS